MRSSTEESSILIRKLQYPERFFALAEKETVLGEWNRTLKYTYSYVTSNLLQFFRWYTSKRLETILCAKLLPVLPRAIFYRLRNDVSVKRKIAGKIWKSRFVSGQTEFPRGRNCCRQQPRRCFHQRQIFLIERQTCGARCDARARVCKARFCHFPWLVHRKSTPFDASEKLLPTAIRFDGQLTPIIKGSFFFPLLLNNFYVERKNSITPPGPLKLATFFFFLPLFFLCAFRSNLNSQEPFYHLRRSTIVRKMKFLYAQLTR